MESQTKIFETQADNIPPHSSKPCLSQEANFNKENLN